MTPHDSIAELAGRLEKASEGSRELDVLLGCLTDDTYELTRTLAECVSKFGLEWAVEAAGSHSSILRHTLPHFSTSIDAALALMARLLPTLYHYELDYNASALESMAFVAGLHFTVDDPPTMRDSHAQAPTLPLAIILALVRSLSSTERQ